MQAAVEEKNAIAKSCGGSIFWIVDPEEDQLRPYRYNDVGELEPVVWAPQQGSQEAIFEATNHIEDLDFLEILLEGNRGGGKTDAMLMAFGQHMGEHYPFTLADKLRVITEPCAWYTAEGGKASPWGRAIMPFEMISVLLGSSSAQAGFRPRGPAVGLFAGQQIRLIQGPLFVDHPYELEREIIALSESARTESTWVRTRVFDGHSRALVAEMILNSAVLKASYADYEREARSLGRH